MSDKLDLGSKRRPMPRMTGVFFRESAPFNSEVVSCSVGQNGVESLLPASIDESGRPAVAKNDGDRAADGVLVGVKVRQPNGSHVSRLCLVPWSNVRGVVFEDIEEGPAAA